MVYYVLEIACADIAQLVERLNGIEKVRGSTPLISTRLSVWIGLSTDCPNGKERKGYYNA